VALGITLAHGGCSSHTTATGECTIAPPVQDAFCRAVASYDGRCGHCQDCTAKNLQNCTQKEATLSSAYLAAYVACADSAPCGGDPAYSACVEQDMASATPTAAQAQAKTAYCAACSATNAADCAAFFSADPSSGTTGAGYNVLLYDDDLATKAAATCTSDCDPFHYAVCVALLACVPAGGDYCSDGGFCAPH
jgi:hypothetical protein